MSALLDIYIKKEKLETLLKTLNAKGENGIGITVSVSDEANNYGQNTSAFVSQTKEQRDAKKEKFYIGNGKVFWTDGKIEVIKTEPKPKQAEVIAESEDNLGLPF
jgi:hypothetical protein